MKKEFYYPNHLHDFDHVPSRLIIGEEGACQNALVSVIMPIFNHPDFFAKALLSVINQKCSFDYEIVIVDNNHPEFQKRNQEIVEKCECEKIRYYLNEQNIGGVNNVNRGIILSKGEYITFCHDDDMLHPDALKNLIEYKNKVPKDALIFGKIEAVDENDEAFPVRTSALVDSFRASMIKLSNRDLLISNLSNGCGSLYRRECVLQIGGFCSDYNPCPDYALNSLYLQLYSAYQIKETTLLNRKSKENDTLSCYPEIPKANKKVRQLVSSLSESRSYMRDYCTQKMESIENAVLSAQYDSRISRWGKIKGLLIVKILNAYKLWRVLYNSLFNSIH